jgi:dihydroorotate dehydrogenase electron transfer subunit
MTPRQAAATVMGTFAEGPRRRIRLRAPALVDRLHPGQFVTADLGDVLRQPLLPAAIRATGLDLLLLPGQAAAALAPDETIDLLGPLGCPLPRVEPRARLLLIADAHHLPSLFPMLNQALTDDGQAALLLLSGDGAAPYPRALLPPALELHEVDGDALRATEPVRTLVMWADRVLVATDAARYPALARLVNDLRLAPAADFAQALLMPTVVCGVGACRGCTVDTRQGYRQACTDGPFFNLLELEGIL